MAKAIWRNVVLAESGNTETLDGNHYFPSDSLRGEYFRDSDAHTVCGWKGTASYYDVVVDDEVNEQAAWYYPSPKSAASNIEGYVAFWKGVQVQE